VGVKKKQSRTLNVLLVIPSLELIISRLRVGGQLVSAHSAPILSCMKIDFHLIIGHVNEAGSHVRAFAGSRILFAI